MRNHQRGPLTAKAIGEKIEKNKIFWNCIAIITDHLLLCFSCSIRYNTGSTHLSQVLIEESSFSPSHRQYSIVIIIVATVRIVEDCCTGCLQLWR